MRFHGAAERGLLPWRRALSDRGLTHGCGISQYLLLQRASPTNRLDIRPRRTARSPSSRSHCAGALRAAWVWISGFVFASARANGARRRSSHPARPPADLSAHRSAATLNAHLTRTDLFSPCSFADSRVLRLVPYHVVPRNFEVIAMNTRNRSRHFPFAVMIATALTAWLQPAMATESLTSSQHHVCWKYVREHHGHPGKGVDVVKVVDPCPKHG
jgi:hypothetical protein